MYAKINVQLAKLSPTPPSGNEWLHENKFDGYRMLAFIHKSKVRLISRNHHDWSNKFPSIINALAALNLPDCVLDGEIIAVDEKQHSNFQILQNSFEGLVPVKLMYYLFDIIYYQKNNICNLSLLERKNLLQQVLPANNAIIKYSHHVIGNGEKVFKKACKLGLEGIISKKS
jgi:bifunctional non-homologous end joining protein LigD